jgi:tetratricopeptide (TPR) repeat protein
MPTSYKRRGALFACLLFVVPAAFGQKGEMPLTGSKEAVALFRQGQTKAENLEDPGTLFDQAVQKDPNFAFGYLFAGQNNVEGQKNLETAYKLADKASPGEREWIMSVWEANNGNPAGRLSHLQQLLKLHPGDKRVQVLMSTYYTGIDDAESLRYLDEAVRIDKNFAPAYNSIGYANMALGRYPQAESAFKSYIKLIPNNPNPYDSYAEFLMRTGKYDESIKQYNMALAKDPTFYPSYRGIGDNYVYKGDYAKGREIFQTMYTKAPQEGNRDQALSSTVNSWLAEGNYQKALEVNDQRIANFEKAGDKPTAIGLHNLSGVISVEAGDLDGAAKHFAMARTMAEDPALPGRSNRSFNLDLQSARLAAARGDFAAANAALDSAGKYAMAGNNVNAMRNYNFMAGYVALKQKQYAKASEMFGKANPNDPYTWYYRALASEGAGDAKGAADLYGNIINWNQLDTPGGFVVRQMAMAKMKK